MPKQYLAVDLGAESGRAILGKLENGRLHIEEAYRFRNEPVSLHGTLVWDFPAILRGVRRGIVEASRLAGGRIDGIAVDSWGVDFGLLDRRGRLLSPPVHYRDTRHVGALEKVVAQVPREKIWQQTGVQFLEINTLFQLAALREQKPEQLENASRLLLIADIVAYFLGARPVTEVTLASTSQLLNAHTRSWSEELITALDLPLDIFPEIVDSGTVVGELSADITREASLERAPPIICAASHDTAAAVACVPTQDRGDWAYLSSGTWSLLGVETTAPVIRESALERRFTNEAGVDGTTRFLSIITGLWLVQECRRQWAREGDELGYDELARLAENARPAEAFIDPDDPRFSQPGDMPQRVRDACRDSGQPVPGTRADIIRLLLESLARRYAEVTRDAGTITGLDIQRLHVVGGGSRHRLLNSLTARELGLPLVVGPVEATAMGNILLQARATGEIADLASLRRIARASSSLETVETDADEPPAPRSGKPEPDPDNDNVVREP